MLSKLMQEHIPTDIRKMRKKNFIEDLEGKKLKNIEYVENGHGWVAVTECPLCGNKKYIIELEVHRNQLLKCTACEVRYHEKIPADFNDIYQVENYTPHTKGLSNEDFNYRKDRFGSERVKLLQKYCGELQNKSLLDVGCGIGDLLAAAQGAFKRCVGSEFSEHLRKFAHEKTKLNIYPNPLDSFPEKDFDVITAIDVIEHIPEPIPFMSAAVNLLNDNGHIMLYTPNYESISIHVMQEFSNLISGTGHVILYNHHSLQQLGEQVGLEVVHTETRGLDISSIASFLDYQNKSGAEFILDYGEELQAIINASGAADYLRVIYKKK